jgi:glycosyltransferase involved in cell wall biosynthesis
MLEAKVVILHNIISPYKTLLFNALCKIYSNLEVFYISETEHRREWEINKGDLKFPYKIMFDFPVDEVSPASMFKETWKHLNASKPDLLIIDGYSYAYSWAGLFWAKKHKKKIILWSSSNEDDHKRVFYKESIKSFFIKNCDAYNAYGTKSKDYLIKLGAKKDRVFIVGNNTDNSFYYRETLKWRGKRDILRQEYKILPNNFLYVGRFSAEKNILFLLDAYKRAVEGNDNWGLILVGNGPQKLDIEHYIEKFNVRNVFLPGFKQKDEIPKFFAMSDVFILPSTSETWGLVVNEAMAAGLPVLVSRKCGCYPDLIKESENGFSFDPYDRNQLVSLLKAIIDNQVDLKRMGEVSLRIIEDYTPEKAADIILNTIKFLYNDD